MSYLGILSNQLVCAISKQDLKAKIRMLNSYTSQLELRRPYFGAKLRGLATIRGMQCGSKGFAEA